MPIIIPYNSFKDGEAVRNVDAYEAIPINTETDNTGNKLFICFNKLRFSNFFVYLVIMKMSAKAYATRPQHIIFMPNGMVNYAFCTFSAITPQHHSSSYCKQRHSSVLHYAFTATDLLFYSYFR